MWVPFNLNDFLITFLSIILEGLPFLLVGSILSVILDVTIPDSWINRISPKNVVAGALVGGTLGLIFPVCECGMIPIIRRLLKRGMPLPLVMAYMLSSPIMNGVSAVSTYIAFQGQSPFEMTALRLIGGYSIAVLVSLLISRIPLPQLLKPGVTSPSLFEGGFRNITTQSSQKPKLSWPKIANSATKDFLDITFYFICGTMLAAAFSTMVNRPALAEMTSNPLIAIQIMMLAAALLSVCSTSDAFIAAALIGVPLSAKLAFLIFGPMFDLKLMFLYSSVFYKKAIAQMTIAIAFLTVIFCLCAHYFRWI
ncbi:MAG: permease [Verrucomicrobiota bacterium]|nr:permease [Verrucomicrobiota bacterium]